MLGTRLGGVASMSFAVAVRARPWRDPPQPAMLSSAVTFTSAASRTAPQGPADADSRSVRRQGESGWMDANVHDFQSNVPPILSII